MDPQFEPWSRLLKGEDVERAIDKPLAGFYRIKRRSKQTGRVSLHAIAYWYENGEFMCAIDGKPVDELLALEQWPWASRNPVSYDAYDAVVEQGKPWPDQHQIEAEAPPLDGIEEMAGRLDDDPPPAGHNSGATVDELRLLADEIDEAKRGIKQYATITSDEQSARAQSFRSDTLLRLAGDADKRREAIKRPHLEAIRDIDGKWMPLVKSAKALADTVRASMGVWETAKVRKAEAERRQLEERQAEAEAEAAEAAEHAQSSVDRGEPPPDPVPQQQIAAPPPRAPQTTIRGGTGRAAHVSHVTVITDVTDWPALFAYFVEDQGARAYLLKRAQMILKSTGEIPPGCKTDLEAKVA